MVILIHGADCILCRPSSIQSNRAQTTSVSAHDPPPDDHPTAHPHAEQPCTHNFFRPSSFIVNFLQDNAPSLAKRLKKSDVREIESFYQQYYEHYVRALDKGEQADQAQLGKAYQTAGVLFEVLCTVMKTEKVEEDAPEIIAAARDVQEKKEIYVPYNILPLDAAGASQPIMQLEEIKASVAALKN